MRSGEWWGAFRRLITSEKGFHILLVYTGMRVCVRVCPCLCVRVYVYIYYIYILFFSVLDFFISFSFSFTRRTHENSEPGASNE